VKAASTTKALRETTRRLIIAFGALDDARRPCGTPLPTPHAWALLELRARGPLTVTDLASHLRIDRTNVSRLCARMEKLGELERRAHPHDRRARLVQLTPTGEELARRVDRASTAHFQRVLDQLDANPTAVIESLLALAAAMESCPPPTERPQ
jgi:putative acetyltransferase